MTGSNGGGSTGSLSRGNCSNKQIMENIMVYQWQRLDYNIMKKHYLD